MANPNTVALSPPGRHGPLIGFFERAPIIAGSAVAVLGVLVIAGWAFNLSFITTPRPGGYPMLPLTALCFVLGAGTIAVAMTGDMKLWTFYVTVVLVGAKIAAFAIQYAAFRLLVGSRIRAAARA